MIRSIATLRSVGTWIVVVSALFSCKPVKQDGNIVDTSQAASILIPQDTTFIIDPNDMYSEDWNTPLPPGVDSNAATFSSQIDTTAFAAHKRDRWRAGKCNGNGNCPVKVEVVTVASTRNLDTTAPPASAQRFVRLRNKHPGRTEAYYGLKPEWRATYYFWVDGVSGKTRITTLEVPVVGKVRAGRQWYLRVCHHYVHPDATPVDADFVEYRPEGPCEGTAVAKKAAPARLSLSVVARIMAWAGIALPPVTLQAEGGWIDCNSGCCW